MNLKLIDSGKLLVAGTVALEPAVQHESYTDHSRYPSHVRSDYTLGCIQIFPVTPIRDVIFTPAILLYVSAIMMKYRYQQTGFNSKHVVTIFIYNM